MFVSIFTFNIFISAVWKITSIASLTYHVLNLFKKKFFLVIDHVKLSSGLSSVNEYNKHKNIGGLPYTLRK